MVELSLHRGDSRELHVKRVLDDFEGYFDVGETLAFSDRAWEGGRMPVASRRFGGFRARHVGILGF